MPYSMATCLPRQGKPNSLTAKYLSVIWLPTYSKRASADSTEGVCKTASVLYPRQQKTTQESSSKQGLVNQWSLTSLGATLSDPIPSTLMGQIKERIEREPKHETHKYIRELKDSCV